MLNVVSGKMKCDKNYGFNLYNHFYWKFTFILAEIKLYE